LKDGTFDGGQSLAWPRIREDSGAGTIGDDYPGDCWFHRLTCRAIHLAYWADELAQIRRADELMRINSLAASAN
jgi:hypothetical protein